MSFLLAISKKGGEMKVKRQRKNKLKSKGGEKVMRKTLSILLTLALSLFLFTNLVYATPGKHNGTGTDYVEAAALAENTKLVLTYYTYGSRGEIIGMSVTILSHMADANGHTYSKTTQAYKMTNAGLKLDKNITDSVSTNNAGQVTQESTTISQYGYDEENNYELESVSSETNGATYTVWENGEVVQWSEFNTTSTNVIVCGEAVNTESVTTSESFINLDLATPEQKEAAGITEGSGPRNLISTATTTVTYSNIIWQAGGFRTGKEKTHDYALYEQATNGKAHYDETFLEMGYTHSTGTRSGVEVIEGYGHGYDVQDSSVGAEIYANKHQGSYYIENGVVRKDFSSWEKIWDIAGKIDQSNSHPKGGSGYHPAEPFYVNGEIGYDEEAGRFYFITDKHYRNYVNGWNGISYNGPGEHYWLDLPADVSTEKLAEVVAGKSVECRLLMAGCTFQSGEYSAEKRATHRSNVTYEVTSITWEEQPN